MGAVRDGRARRMCDTSTMTTWFHGGPVRRGPSARPRRPAAMAALLGAGVMGCASQHDTAQALTIAGAAAVVVGASLAADSPCHEGPGGGGAVAAYCSPGASRGVRRAGTAAALAGVGVAAAGYALQPKGPDRLAPPRSNLPAAAAPYRLIRAVPPEGAVPEASEGSSAVTPGGSESSSSSARPRAPASSDGAAAGASEPERAGGTTCGASAPGAAGDGGSAPCVEARPTEPAAPGGTADPAAPGAAQP